MEKKYLIIVIIVIAIIAVVAIVILKTLKEGTNPPGLLNAECTDSDNGKDYNTQGFITGIVPGGKEEPGDLEDLCVLGGTPTDECEGDKSGCPVIR